MLICLVLLLRLVPVLAADTNSSSDTIPPLRPPRGEIPPTYWEQHAPAILAIGVMSVLLIAGASWLVRRPKPPVLPAPAAVARSQLQPLSNQPETGVVLSQISQAVRHYVAAAFDLATGEFTTTDLCLMLATRDVAGPELNAALGDFLRRCDQRKFAPAVSLPPLGAVAEALNLIERCEARLSQLRQAASASRNEG
jgi:hypothetical protein